MPYKIFLGSLATTIAFVAYIPYFVNIFRGKTKPHAFSWLVWGIISGIGFLAQLTEGGGSGSWVTGFGALVSCVIFSLALLWGDRHFSRFDWMSLLGAGIAIFLWWLTGEPLLSLILVIIIDALGFLPTFRKGFYKPYEETATTWGLNSLKFMVALPALESFTLTTWLYPVYLVLANGTFVTMLWVRRKRR